ncbi:MAG: O-antigen ligase family protein [Rikenellaceae bacterium]|nr:O-antigen ligase family protein [Rikenellaceae bacterium]
MTGMVRVNRVIEWIVIIAFFVGNIIITRYTLGQIKDYVFVSGLAAVIPLYIINIWRQRAGCDKRYVETDFLSIALGGFCAVIALSALWSGAFVDLDSRGYLLILLLAPVLYYHIRSLDRPEKERFLRRFIAVLFITGLLQALMGIAQYAFDEDAEGIYKTLATGTLIYPNLYGGYLAIALGAGCLLLYRRRKTRSRYAYCAAITVIVFALLLSRSRGAMLSLMLSVGTIFLCYFYTIRFRFDRRQRRRFLFGFIVAATALTTAFLYIDRSSSEGRLMKMQIGSSMMRDHPFFGIGHGQYANVYLDYQADFFKTGDNHRFIARANEDRTTNNQFLKFAIEFGVIGLVIFVFVLFLIARKILSSDYLRCGNPYNYFIAFSALCLMFHMFFDETLRFPIIVILFLILCAFVPVRADIKIIMGPVLATTGRIFSTGLLVAIFVTSGLYVRQYAAVRSYSQARLFLSAGDFSNANFFALRALDISPDYPAAKIISGRSLIGLGGDGIGKSASQTAEGIAILESLGHRMHSRDILLALSIGHFKSHSIEKAYEYAYKVHEFFPAQVRPRLMLHLMNIEDLPSDAELEYDIRRLPAANPDKERIIALMEIIGRNDPVNAVRSPHAIQLLDLIMLAH